MSTRERRVSRRRQSAADLIALTAAYQLVKKNFEAARIKLEYARSIGSSAACWLLGEMYVRGDGVPRDVNRGMELFVESANRGWVYGQYMIGEWKIRGMNGFPVDVQCGFALVRRAALGGDGRARLYLASLYFHGVGTPRRYYRSVVLVTHSWISLIQIHRAGGITSKWVPKHILGWAKLLVMLRFVRARNLVTRFTSRRIDRPHSST